MAYSLPAKCLKSWTNFVKTSSGRATIKRTFNLVKWDLVIKCGKLEGAGYGGSIVNTVLFTASGNTFGHGEISSC